MEPGRYVIEAAASSRDIRLSAPVTVDGQPYRPPVVTIGTTVGHVIDIPGVRELIDDLFRSMPGGAIVCGEAVSSEVLAATCDEMPLHALSPYTRGKLERADVAALIEKINGLL